MTQSKPSKPVGAAQRPQTRIQKRNRETILEAGLEVFSAFGFRGSTLDQIAKAAGLSKPNLLYYFPSKEAIHIELLSELMDDWLAPLRAMDAAGEPREEILRYVRRKLEMSQEMPRESRLFANEMLQGAPHVLAGLSGDLKALVDAKAAMIRGWSEDGRIAPVDPYHLIFSIWALTQHYADFDVQVRAILGPGHDPFIEAESYLEMLFTRLLAPDPGR
ncbi:TetR family transcriptional regulator C-terminal domain-containing protein [Pseudothioclava arenosa]|uniref:TetR family transcriptional regulator n=1 Tax=Pseudothioclava arenosa TaxID=1795308 RepID=A0A2A4CSQ3_9RHOB|nr:TetR family transcriptional regulator C-terminal domain-containing protein [Pseudothioclava arenosa]PCD77156.1 TetR family transcriptional regulator [Pseudothioclava arenosa]